jgi:Zn-finger nucleic acid-binding protein
MRSNNPCPACEGNLIGRSLHEVSFWTCVQCQGLWIDRDELVKLGKKTQHQAACLPTSFKGPVASPKVHSKDCPQCPEVILRGFDFLGVKVDMCPKCEGIWLDRGEIALIFKNYRSSRTYRFDDMLVEASKMHGASTPFGAIYTDTVNDAKDIIETVMDFLSLFNA